MRKYDKWRKRNDLNPEGNNDTMTAITRGRNTDMGKTVAKFGGTSLADAEQFRKVRDIILADPGRKYVVVSAPGKRFPEDTKVTDLLLGCYEKAVRGEDPEQELQAVGERYREIAERMNIDFPIADEINILREKLRQEPDRAYAASRGEYLCARLMAQVLDYTFVDPAWCVSFNEDGTLNMKMTMRTLKAALLPLEHVVIAGFYGADTNERIHLFSRGGSDITGSLVALAIEADLYENWTDVSGLLAADPKIIDSPRSVRNLTYRELRTLSYMGATVLHTDAVLPAADAGIPINIRNTNDPEDPGTMIVRHIPPEVTRHAITGVAGRKGMCVVQVEKVMVSDGAGFTAVMLDMLKRRNIPFEQCLTGIDTITLVIRGDVLADCREELLKEIREVLKPDHVSVREGLSMIAVTGEKDPGSSNANSRVLQALSAEGIEISTINQGAGKLNLLIGIPEENYDQAIRIIYRTLENS